MATSVLQVGEEDHLRIMCMQRGSVLNEVFDRLEAALKVRKAAFGLSVWCSDSRLEASRCAQGERAGLWCFY